MPSPRKRIKVFKLSFRKKVLLAFLFSLLAVGSVAGCISYELNRPAGSGLRKEVVIERGETLRQITTKLSENGLIRSPNLFIVYVTLKGLSSQIEAGRYEIPPSLSLREVIEVLRHGSFDIKLTFLEGWRREEFLEYALKRLPVDSAGFTKEFMAETQGLEGYLFPDTYLVPQDISAEELVVILRDNFEKKYAEVAEAVVTRNISKEQAVILASLVERETKSAEEAAVIAGILLKRLNFGWTLDVDASVQYALGYQEKEGTWWKKELTLADLAVGGPYNTRRVQGLPPGPICNPGLMALKAVANPQASEYLYYLHDKDGNVHFAETLEEHNQNVAKYLR